MIYAFASNFVLVRYLMGPAFSIPTTWKGVAPYILTLGRFPVGGFIIVTMLDEPRVELLKPRYQVLLSGFRHGQPHSLVVTEYAGIQYKFFETSFSGR